MPLTVDQIRDLYNAGYRAGSAAVAPDYPFEGAMESAQSSGIDPTSVEGKIYRAGYLDAL